MAKKRRRKKARRRSRRSNPKRTHRRRKHRRNAAPRKRRAARRRAHKRNPRRRHRVRGHFARRKGRRVRVRGHISNPKRSRRRHRRRNPGGMVVELAKAVGAAIVGFLGTFALGFFLTPAAQLASKQGMYRGAVGAAGATGGYFLAKKHPAFGYGLAAGSILGALGGFLMTKLIAMLPQKSGGSQAQQQSTNGLAAVFTNNLAAVFNQDMQGFAQQMSGYGQQLSAVYTNDMRGIGALPPASSGEFAPAVPWQVSTPFDHRGL
jgi:hypothetical protein